MPKNKKPKLDLKREAALLNYKQAQTEEWQKLEKWSMPGFTLPEGLPDPISYFDNYKEHPKSNVSDFFLNPVQGWDQRNNRCDRRYMDDIRLSIHNEQMGKKVPAMTSMQYGRPRTPPLDYPQMGFGRIQCTKGFFSSKGTNIGPERGRPPIQSTMPDKI